MMDDYKHGYFETGGCRLHYVEAGRGPLLVLYHGFPMFWFSFYPQIEALKTRFRVVAIDGPGVNLSSKPQNIELYKLENLALQIDELARHLSGDEPFYLVGHDWGGAVAWQVAIRHPEVARNLIILNLPHPNGLMRELTTNETQRQHSAYAQTLKHGSHSDPKVFFGQAMTPNHLAGWVKESEVRDRYIEAFERSSMSGMIAYYQQNYPELPPRAGSETLPLPVTTKVQAPVLIFHGLEDQALHPNGLNQTWEWLEAEMTLMTLPGAGHFVHRDKASVVSSTMLTWLEAHHSIH